MSNSITKAGFRSSGPAARESSEAFTPYVVNPNGGGTFLTISEAIDQVVLDGASATKNFESFLARSLTSEDRSSLQTMYNLHLGPNVYI